MLTAGHERLARDVGAAVHLPLTLGTKVGVCLFTGDVAEAALLADQVQVVTDASG